MIAVSWICLRHAPRRVDRWFRRLQLVSSAAYSIGHGSNDAQKTMGIIWLLLIASGRHHQGPPAGLGGHLAATSRLRLGTMFGGWRIVKTMGQTHHQAEARSADSPPRRGGAITLFMATYFGIPVSTTHTITGAIIGVGTAQRHAAVRWGVAGNIVIAWIVTIPASAASRQSPGGSAA